MYNGSAVCEYEVYVFIMPNDDIVLYTTFNNKK